MYILTERNILMCLYLYAVFMAMTIVYYEVECVLIYRNVAKFSDQDQESLMVKRRNDSHSPGPVIRELVLSSNQRSELQTGLGKQCRSRLDCSSGSTLFARYNFNIVV